jgi:hypothetical protein
MTQLQFWYKKQSRAIRVTVRDAIIKKCEIHSDTFYRWLNEKMPGILYQKIISDITGIKVEDLYKPINN